MPTEKPRPQWRRLRRLASRYRRPVAAVLAAASVACTVTALRPPEPQRVPVLAAATDLVGGTPLAREDVTKVALRPAAVPAGALRPGAEVAGRVLAGPVRAGAPITDARLVGPELVTSDGLVATPVRVADPGVTRLLHAGDRVNLLAASTRAPPGNGPARVVASGVRIVAIPRPDGGYPAAGDGAGRRISGAISGNAGAALLLLATTPEEAAEIAGAAVTSRLTVTVLPGAGNPEERA